MVALHPTVITFAIFAVGHAVIVARVIMEIRLAVPAVADSDATFFTFPATRILTEAVVFASQRKNWYTILTVCILVVDIAEPVAITTAV